MESTTHVHHNSSCCSYNLGNTFRQSLSELDFERGIWYAAQYNDLDRVRYLLNKGISPNVEDNAGYTALHYAVRNGHDEICNELLKRGANVNAVTRSGRATPLHRAATQKYIHIVELLLNANADTNMQDVDGFTALHRALIANCDQISRMLIPKTRMDLIDKFNYTVKDLSEKIGKQDLFF
ncbi:PREDICTED: ankyrin repeat domain-containing protein 39 [Ceratosolen solmsi marchali]|uniref:Ankyrin repeat domain-containing protein 39 n=1 Tax=Ceratosolen solmsi marchali TaxID=326594 RepID=A0AAJ6VMS8_9HYME|nr:PREDICTED: ankyrin repeat domain-containing protein 39 [Ceratosolen solmsi marchali]